MPDHYETKLPIEAVRDLLGIARALYATLAAMGPGHNAELLMLQGIGYQLTLAIERASESGPGTFKHRNSWLIAEKAATDLAEMVGDLPAKSLAIAAGDRLRRR